MPAARGGVAVGDTILEIEGQVVPGVKANKVLPLLERPIGETISFKLLRVNGEEYVVRLASVARR